nr:immunoglobulin light chain junction region [Macaca mulatta]MOW11298.1 immunoglobulin light chain junction region [Macaca mulatta]MOW13484.1 immunoglobulin light chain junction region [Macaca mulatta]MOX87996.1 immunoglobulin light chain junction region [Macaca mulatta]MOX89196.1 immunoglobulin light chain junction region [Macaca mulatta]
CGQGTKVPYSF